MGKLWFEQEVRDRLRGKPHLLPVLSGIYDIPERLREYDPALFLVFNARLQKYEVHSLNHMGNTFACEAGSELHPRILDYIRRHDLRTRGREIFDEMDRHNERLLESKRRAGRNMLRSAVRESHRLMARAAWGGKTVWGPGSFAREG